MARITSRKKVGIALLSILVLAGLYIFLRFAFGIFTPYNFFTAYRDIRNQNIQIIAVGEPGFPEVEQKIAARYGFQFHYVGCVVTPEIMNGSRYYNDVIREYLSEQHGENFWSTFRMEVDSNVSAIRKSERQ